MPDQGESGPAQARDTARPKRRRTRTRSSQGRRKNTYAALDLGTNNCRLLIARPNDVGFRVIDSYSKVVRLGAGLSHTGVLSEESMDAAVEALGMCSRKMQAKSVKRWRCVATQACRQATNGTEFLKRVKSETGLSLEIISPRVEARLAVMGCLNLIDTTKDVVLVVDIGGGSTELSWVDVRELRDPDKPMKVHRPPISAWASIPLGVVTLSELVPDEGDINARYEEMKKRVRNALSDASSDTRFTKAFKSGKGHIIGTSGTITTLAGIHLKLPFYQRDKVDGIWMPSQAVINVANDMGLKTVHERAQEPCIGEDRANLLAAGCAITEVISTMWPCERIRVADRGLREGMLMGLMDQTQTVGGENV